MVHKKRIRNAGALWEKSGGGWLGYYISDTCKRKTVLEALYKKGEL